MTAQPAISIVMPTYNMAPFLLESIPSVLSQSFVDFELIVVDDGSIDQTMNHVLSFVDSRVVYISREHDYLDSMNAGITAAKGKYIVRMDADDLMAEGRLMKQYHYMEAHPEIDVCGGGIEMFGDANGTFVPLINHDAIAALLLLRNAIAHPTVIMRKCIVDKYIIKHGALYDKTFIYAEDYHLWTSLIMEGYRFANMPDVLVNYRVSEKAVSVKHADEMKDAVAAAQRIYMKFAIGEILWIEKQYLPLIEDVIKLSSMKLLALQDVSQFVYTLYCKILFQEKANEVN